MKVALTHFTTSVGKASDFEKSIKNQLRKSGEIAGAVGAILLRSDKDPDSFLVVGFWKSKEDYEAFVKSGAREEIRGFLKEKPKVQWFDPLARLQQGKFFG